MIKIINGVISDQHTKNRQDKQPHSPATGKKLSKKEFFSPLRAKKLKMQAQQRSQTQAKRRSQTQAQQASQAQAQAQQTSQAQAQQTSQAQAQQTSQAQAQQASQTPQQPNNSDQKAENTQQLNQNILRSYLTCSDRQGNPNLAHSPSAAILQHGSPQANRSDVSTRLPLILKFSHVAPNSSHEQFVEKIFFSSPDHKRSPVAGENALAYAQHSQLSADYAETLEVKACSVSFAEIGKWCAEHGHHRAQSQNAVMHNSAHNELNQACAAYDLPLLLREGKTPATKSHWMHLIAHSQSATNPQMQENLVAGSAGANFDHIIIENAVVMLFKMSRQEDSKITHGLYTVTAQCLPGTHTAVTFKCGIELEMDDGWKKIIVIELDPAKPKLTDRATAAADEAATHQAINEFIASTCQESAPSSTVRHSCYYKDLQSCPPPFAVNQDAALVGANDDSDADDTPPITDSQVMRKLGV